MANLLAAFSSPRSRMWHCVALAVSVALAGIARAASGAQAASDPPQDRATIQALTRARAAVVGVEVTAVKGARSAQALGAQRSGSGVVIGPEGLILTVGNLMLEAESIRVTTSDGRTLPARAVGYDLATGFGLLRALLSLRDVAPAPLGSLGEVQPGDAVMAATGGQDGEVAMTQVVGHRPFSASWEYSIESALFTSPPIDNHGGAPVFNQRGELLGVCSLFVGDASDGQGDEQVPGNMFVPVDLLKPILAELQQHGTTRQGHRPWLGIISTVQAGQVHLVRLTQDGPAALAGLRPGDVVLAVDGEPVATLAQFYKKLWARPEPDSEVNLTVQQGDQQRIITVKGVDRITRLVKPAGI